MPLGVDTLGLAIQSRIRHDVMHDLALESRHRLQAQRLSRTLHLLTGLRRGIGEYLPPVRSMASNVEHQPAALSSARLHGQSSELLQRLENLTIRTDQTTKRAVTATLCHDRQGSSAV